MNTRWLMVGVLLLAVAGSPAWALFCTACGAQAADDARFCAYCGKPLAARGAPAPSPEPASGPADPAEVGSFTVLAAPPAPQAFQVTSKYLQVAGYRVSRDSLFWIAEVRGDHARIWCVGEPPGTGLIMGWVSMAELEKRSTLKPGTVISCVEPPPPTAEIVVIHDRPYWRHWRPRSFRFHWHHRD